jgi:hypothetical protein
MHPKKELVGAHRVDFDRDNDEMRGVMPARPPTGRDYGGIQALDRAFLIRPKVEGGACDGNRKSHSCMAAAGRIWEDQ